MPVAPKNKVAYGVLVGAMQNRGMSLEEAKSKTDKALADNPKLGPKMAKQYGKKKSGTVRKKAAKGKAKAAGKAKGCAKGKSKCKK